MIFSRRTTGILFVLGGSLSLISSIILKPKMSDFSHGFCLGLSLPLLVAGCYHLIKSRTA